MKQNSCRLKTLALIFSIAFLYHSGCKNNSITSPVVPGPLGQYKIAYTSVNIQNGHTRIYSMNSDGTNKTALTSDTTNSEYPEWSPDGKKIVFVGAFNGDRAIFSMNADGTGKTFLASSAGDDYDERPVWSPDGSRIVFVRNEMGGGIYLMNRDGTNSQRLTTGSSPVWSPDGSKIAFLFTDTFSGASRVSVMNADGINIRQLSSDINSFRYPDWSPDGMKIAFRSQRDGNGEIYTVNRDGTNQLRLTNDPRDDGMPAWSPDGTKIAFISSGSGVTEMHIMNADGSNKQLLASGAGYPVWAPDGTKILFSTGGISIIDPDGTNQKILTSGYDLYPSWSPVRF